MFEIDNKSRRNVLVACDHGLMLINRFDYNQNQVGHGQFILDHGNLCTLETQNCIDAIRHLSNPIILDIGANIGGFSSWMARYFNKGKIYCFEPQRLVYQILCANMSINNLDNVYAYNIALGNQTSKIKFLEPNYNVPNDFGTFSLVRDTIKEKSNEIIIDMYSLDDFVDQYQISQLDLLKIDTEGMEIMILQGGQRSIKKFKPVLFIEYSDGVDSWHDQIEIFLNEYNYSYQYIGNNLLAKSKYE
jgi:FkbM family methyltransferase